MATTKYITPITDRTQDDVIYARANQSDLTNKNKGAWNYTDANRVCNNLKYAAEWMHDQGFFSQPYIMNIKTDWKETDIITYEQLNSMIVNNMNNLKSYSRDDLPWYPITSIANMNYTLANWLERDIDMLATQVPPPPAKYKLTIENGSGSGEYESHTEVTISANAPEEGKIFSNWSGDHLENIKDASASTTTYTMPGQDIRLTANYINKMPHNLTIKTYTKTSELNINPGEDTYIEADPAPNGKVFHHWEVDPSIYEKNLYEPAASTHFTMPNTAVTLTAIYITKGQKELEVRDGKGSGWYDYDSYASISSNKPAGAVFTNWTGDTQYLAGPTTQEYNSVKIPDVPKIRVYANWRIPPVTNVKVTLVNGTFATTGESTGVFTEGDNISIIADSPKDSKQTFRYWQLDENGDGDLHGGYNRTKVSYNSTATFTVGKKNTTITANYSDLIYSTLTVTTASGTTVKTLESWDYFSVDASPIPVNKVFDGWSGNTDSFDPHHDYIYFEPGRISTGTYMGNANRTITANYRDITEHTLTIKQPSGDQIYTGKEGTQKTLVADPAALTMEFTGWSQQGPGEIQNNEASTTMFTYGNGDTIITPNYVNIWNITIVDSDAGTRTTYSWREGNTYDLKYRDLAIYEKWEGWALDGPGSIRNTASPDTYFTVGAGDATITGSISKYPDITLSLYYQDPNTNTSNLISTNTYQYGSTIEGIEAPIAPDKTIFSTWLGSDEDLSLITPSALASTINIPHLTKDAVLTATYYYPESEEEYTLTIENGTPEEGSYKAGSQIPIRANSPAQGYEFYSWFGDTQFIVNQEGLKDLSNAVIMPKRSISLKAKYTVVGELPLFRIIVAGGTASATYTTGDKANPTIHELKDQSTIDVPAGTEVTLKADPDTVDYTFSFWDGFNGTGITDVDTQKATTVFTMVEMTNDLKITMNRRQKNKYTLTTKNATGGGEVYEGIYPIAGNLQNTDDIHYQFENWTCHDSNNEDCISAIEDANAISTNITISDKDLWAIANYKVLYKLNVVNGQDSGVGYYSQGSVINTVSANTPEVGLQFDHWDDPNNIITTNIYDTTPTIVMKDSIATITAVYTANNPATNSIITTTNDLHEGIINRSKSALISGVYSVGTLAFDKDGCIGVITEVDPDKTDDTDDFKVTKLFYGGGNT